jgi:hypothetical protein
MGAFRICRWSSDGASSAGVAGFQAINHNDAASGIRPAGYKISLDTPTFRGFGQFNLYILTLGE